MTYSGKHEYPNRDHHAGKQRGTKKKWSEAIRKDCRTPVLRVLA
jgi:hypothetical protein